MAKSEFKGINLQIGQERTINVAMSPAAVSSEINVSGGALAVVDVSSRAWAPTFPSAKSPNCP